MKLEKVEIENFRQYHGKQPIVYFAKSEDKNVTLIHGVNGAGKSNFFKAINWCLYEAVDDGGTIISKAALVRAQAGEVLKTEVRVTFSHEEKRYSLSRSIEFFKLADSGFREQSKLFVMMKTTPDGRTSKVDNPIGELNSILPENTRTYFLFDGEKIDNFSKPESAGDVKNAIYNVLKLEVLTRARKHLDYIAGEYRDELSSIASKELSQLLTQYSIKRAEKEKIINRQTELDKEIKLARNRIANIDQKLESLQEVSHLQKERSRIEEEIKNKAQELNLCISKIRGIATKSSNLISDSILLKAQTIIDSKRAKGEIPSNIREQFIDDIIEQKLCICGRAFDHAGPEHKHLLTLKRKGVSGLLEEEVINLNASVKSLINEAMLKKQELDDEMFRRSSLIDYINQLSAQRDDLSLKLKGSRLENVQKLEDQRQGFSSDIDNYLLEKGKNEEKIKNIDSEVTEINSEIEKAKKDEKKTVDLSKKMTLAQKAADALGAIYQRFADEMRERIEKKTKDVFSTLIWKESQFHDIRLNQDYQLEITDRWGYPASPDLSAGERQVLSLSFISAMAIETGEEAPIVMDTPFGRLSTKHRDNITQNLPMLARQLILFVTDEEFTEQMRINLQPRVGEQYHLQFDDQTGSTTISK